MVGIVCGPTSSLPRSRYRLALLLRARPMVNWSTLYLRQEEARGGGLPVPETLGPPQVDTALPQAYGYLGEWCGRCTVDLGEG